MASEISNRRRQASKKCGFVQGDDTWEAAGWPAESAVRIKPRKR